MIGRADEFQQRIGNVHLRNIICGKRRLLLRLNPGPVIFRRFVAQFLDRQIGDFLAFVNDAEAQIVRGLADNGKVETPFAEDGFGLLFLLGPQHHEHALLAFRQHHLIGRHVLFAHRHLVEIEPDAKIALGAHFDRRAGQPRRAHVLNGDDGAGGHQLKAGFQQALFSERVADLHGRALLFDAVVKLRRSHGRAANAVAPGLCAEIDHGQADAGGDGEEDGVATWQVPPRRR